MNKILIAVPCGTMVHANFMESLYNLATPAGDEVELKIVKSSCLLHSRHELAKTAIAGEFSHILFLDSDMQFPPETLILLMSAKQQVVAANYTTRNNFITPTALIVGHHKLDFKDAHLLRQVEKVGFGCILLSTEIFKLMPQPWFEFNWLAQDMYYMSEDYRFCEKLKTLGIPIFVHNGISLSIGHCGEKVYTHKDVNLRNVP